MPEILNNTFYGVDFGTSNVAVGQIDDTGAYAYLYQFLPDRSPADIHEGIKDFLETTVVVVPGSTVYVEGIFKGTNARTFERMARVSQSIIVSFRELGCECEIVNATSWRSTLFGTSRIKKEECQDWAEERWGWLSDIPKKKSSHLSDSLMISLTAAVRSSYITL